MAINPLFTANIRKTGKRIKVYRHIQSGDWIDYSDCNTRYNTDELKLPNEALNEKHRG